MDSKDVHANGKTTERMVDTHYNADGSGVRTIEYTGADGQSRTRTENFSAPVSTAATPGS